ncbi:putative U6 snRNA-associated Sm-like protein LSm1 [Seiridium cardinale]|uniref:U6 snRNA-associated Sm-like protein LSm1 n=1 Tax=Seiridium cardinale TaxID=138064 RepID=A0ABR2Y858_9PEZI
MENLAIHDTPPPGQGTPQGRFAQQAMAGNAPPQAQHQQLPPQMFTTAAQLLDLTDKKLLICLRDGRKLTGILRSWDQFANLVLQSTIERIYAPLPDAAEDSPVKGYYADKTHGIFLVRGENVLLLGEIDLDKDDETPADFEEKEWKVVEKLAKEKKVTDKVKEKKKLKKLATLGFEGENMGEILL